MLDKILGFIAEHMVIVHVKTVSGKTDANGYIGVGLDLTNIPLWVKDLKINNDSENVIRPCFLYDKNLNRISVRFKTWDDGVRAKSSDISFKIYYIGGVS